MKKNRLFLALLLLLHSHNNTYTSAGEFGVGMIVGFLMNALMATYANISSNDATHKENRTFLHILAKEYPALAEHENKYFIEKIAAKHPTSEQERMLLIALENCLNNKKKKCQQVDASKTHTCLERVYALLRT